MKKVARIFAVVFIIVTVVSCFGTAFASSGYKISGRVTSNGKPVGQMKITDGEYSVTSDNDGYFELFYYESGDDLFLTALKTGFIPVGRRVKIGNKDITVNFDMEEAPGTSNYLIGRVTDKNGKPLEGVKLAGSGPPVFSDEDGAYILGPFMSAELTVNATLSGYKTDDPIVVKLANIPTRVDVVMKKGSDNPGPTNPPPTKTPESDGQGGDIDIGDIDIDTSVTVTVKIEFVNSSGAVVGSSGFTDSKGTKITEKDLTLPDNYKLKNGKYTKYLMQNTTVQVPVVRTSFDAKFDSYIGGYPDGLFLPNNSVSRAEMAQIIYNLYGNEEIIAPGSGSGYSDVSPNFWAVTAIAYNTSKGWLKGVGNGWFEPNRPITRAEFAAIVARIKSLSSSGATDFADVSGHWAAESIEALYAGGYIEGYVEGGAKLFKPNRNITRCEAVVLLNRIEGRSEEFTGNKSFSDVPSTFWGYGAIMNAANGLKPTGNN